MAIKYRGTRDSGGKREFLAITDYPFKQIMYEL